MTMTRMTPDAFKKARKKLGLSANMMAKLLRVSTGRTIRRWELGERDIPGPVEALVEFLLAATPPKLVKAPAKKRSK